jgi:hypothetical protein
MRDIVALFSVLISPKIIETSNVEKATLVFVHNIAKTAYRSAFYFIT